MDSSQLGHAGNQSGKFRRAASGNIALHGSGKSRRKGIHEPQVRRNEIAVEYDAHGMSDGFDLPDKADEGIPYFAGLLKGFTGHMEVKAGGAHR